MLPLVHRGDRAVVIHGCNCLHRCDFLVFQQTENLVVHRLLENINEEDEIIFVTKGNNVPYLDSIVNRDQKVGREDLSVIRGYQPVSLVTWTWGTMGWFIAAINLALFILLNWIRICKLIYKDFP